LPILERNLPPFFEVTDRDIRETDAINYDGALSGTRGGRHNEEERECG
jgi:hypothetical protein